ncbi:MAG TPA: alpha/beta hydrolase-fold protein [Tepidisphaeraceae bacterium]|nr:alpha/beta hydrolase-fold protein [Tepidisphaeraceae bacterium]
MSRLLRWSPCLALLMVVGCMHANPADQLTGMPAGTGFILRTSHGEAGDHKYSVFLPRDYSASKRYPTIVFLHGIGESGSDGIGCTTVGIGPAIARRNGEFPFIVIFPQTGFDWCTENSEHIMLDALRDAEKNYAIDPARISLSGMSSGGKGTWVLGARHPEIFSALVPMGGFSATDEVPRLTRIPTWVLHNDGDFVVGVGNSREMYQQIKAAGGNIRYTEYNAGGHNCWDQAYDEGELFTWLQAQRLGR